MINLSKFAETLNELIFDNGEMNNKEFAAAVGLPEPTVLRYRQGKHTPNLKNLIINMNNVCTVICRVYCYCRILSYLELTN